MFHWSVLLTLPWMWYLNDSLYAAFVSWPAYIFLILAHELGHAYMAQRRNIRVISIQVSFIHGLCTFENPKNEKDHILIAWGGVAAQLFILLMALIFSFLFSHLWYPIQYILSPTVEPILHTLISLNIIILIINLVPIQPLDGVMAWRVLPYIPVWIKKKLNRPSQTETGDNLSNSGLSFIKQNPKYDTFNSQELFSSSLAFTNSPSFESININILKSINGIWHSYDGITGILVAKYLHEGTSNDNDQYIESKSYKTLAARGKINEETSKEAMPEFSRKFRVNSAGGAHRHVHVMKAEMPNIMLCGNMSNDLVSTKWLENGYSFTTNGKLTQP